MHTHVHQSQPTGTSSSFRATAPAAGALTVRDRQVVALVLAGHPNAEIARRLNTQLQTVKNALSGIYDKLGVSTRLQLAVLLLRDGI